MNSDENMHQSQGFKAGNIVVLEEATSSFPINTPVIWASYVCILN